AGGLGAVDGGPDAAALEREALLLGEPAPHAGVLTAVHRPCQAVVDDGAAVAHRLRLLDLQQGRSRRTDGEEQLRVFLAAGGQVTPVHAVPSGSGECRATL